jgi:hypothetical protein
MRGEDEEEIDGDIERDSRRDSIEDKRWTGGGMCAGRDNGLSAICGQYPFFVLSRA